MIEQTNYPIRAPRNGEYFRIHPDESYRQEVTLARGDDDLLYLVIPEMIAKLEEVAPANRIQHCMMFLGVNKDGEHFFWPIELPVPDDHPVYVAMDQWIRLAGVQ